MYMQVASDMRMSDLSITNPVTRLHQISAPTYFRL